MNYGLIGLYGIYLLFVGANKNAAALKTQISADVKGFMPWAIAIVVLAALMRSDTLRPVVKPFIALAVLAFVLKNYPQLVSQLNQATGLNLPGGATS